MSGCQKLSIRIVSHTVFEFVWLEISFILMQTTLVFFFFSFLFGEGGNKLVWLEICGVVCQCIYLKASQAKKKLL